MARAGAFGIRMCVLKGERRGNTTRRPKMKRMLVVLLVLFLMVLACNGSEEASEADEIEKPTVAETEIIETEEIEPEPTSTEINSDVSMRLKELPEINIIWNDALLVQAYAWCAAGAMVELDIEDVIIEEPLDVRYETGYAIVEGSVVAVGSDFKHKYSCITSYEGDLSETENWQIQFLMIDGIEIVDSEIGESEDIEPEPTAWLVFVDCPECEGLPILLCENVDDMGNSPGKVNHGEMCIVLEVRTFEGVERYKLNCAGMVGWLRAEGLVTR